LLRSSIPFGFSLWFSALQLLWTASWPWHGGKLFSKCPVRSTALSSAEAPTCLVGRPTTAFRSSYLCGLKHRHFFYWLWLWFSSSWALAFSFLHPTKSVVNPDDFNTTRSTDSTISEFNNFYDHDCLDNCHFAWFHYRLGLVCIRAMDVPSLWRQQIFLGPLDIQPSHFEQSSYF